MDVINMSLGADEGYSDDPDAIVESVSHLLENRSGWDSTREKARHYVAQERTWSRTVANYKPVYSRLLAGRASTQ